MEEALGAGERVGSCAEVAAEHGGGPGLGRCLGHTVARDSCSLLSGRFVAIAY